MVELHEGVNLYADSVTFGLSAVGRGIGSLLGDGPDMSIVAEAYPWTQAIREGDSSSLSDAANQTANHAEKQIGFADNAQKLTKLLAEAWQGDASDGAQKKVQRLEKEARKTASALQTNAGNFDGQVKKFDQIQQDIRPLKNPPPEAGVLDAVNPLDTDTERDVQEQLDNAEHNIKLYKQYEKDTKSNAEGINEEHGNPGQDFGSDGGDQYGPPEYPQPDYPESPEPPTAPQPPDGIQNPYGDAEDMRLQPDDARRAQEDAQRRAEEEAARQREEARRAQEEAQRRAEEEAARQREQMRRAQEEAQRRAQEQADAMGGQPGYDLPDYQAPDGATTASGYSPSSASDFSPGARSSSYPSGSVTPSSAGGAGAIGAAGGAAGAGASGTGRGPGGGASSGAGAGAGAGASGAGAAGGMRGGVGGGMGRGGMPMGGMMGGGGKGQGDDKEHKRKVKYSENAEEVFGTDEKTVPPVIGERQ